MFQTLAAAITAALVLGADPASAGNAAADGVVRVESVLVTLIEQVETPARESGSLAELMVREGQFVEQGQLLGRLDDGKARLIKSRVQIELDNSRKQAQNDIQFRFAGKAQEVADAELQRAIDSLARYPKSISETEVDRLRLSAQKAALAVEQARFDCEISQYSWKLREAELALADHDIQRRQILAPLSGVVVEVNRRLGEWVEPSETVVRILRMDRLRAEGFVDGREFGGELAGRPVVLRTMLHGGRQAEYAGTIVFVSPEVNPVNGQVRIWAEIDNHDLQLRPGVRGDLTIEAPRSHALKDSHAPEDNGGH